MTTSITGSCLCGAVRYEITKQPVWAHNCHCSRCRKTRGSAFASNLVISPDGFRFLQGESELQSYRPPTAERFTHAFCRHCGATMPWFNKAHDIMIVPMGSLDDDPGVMPLANIFVDSKAPWFIITDDLPKNPGPPGSAK